MRLHYIVAVALALGLATFPMPLLPGSTVTAHAKAKYEVKRKDGRCEYKYKADRKGYKESYKCK